MSHIGEQSVITLRLRSVPGWAVIGWGGQRQEGSPEVAETRLDSRLVHARSAQVCGREQGKAAPGFTLVRDQSSQTGLLPVSGSAPANHTPPHPPPHPPQQGRIFQMQIVPEGLCLVLSEGPQTAHVKHLTAPV